MKFISIALLGIILLFGCSKTTRSTVWIPLSAKDSLEIHRISTRARDIQFPPHNTLITIGSSTADTFLWIYEGKTFLWSGFEPQIINQHHNTFYIMGFVSTPTGTQTYRTLRASDTGWIEFPPRLFPREIALQNFPSLCSLKDCDTLRSSAFPDNGRFAALLTTGWPWVESSNFVKSMFSPSDQRRFYKENLASRWSSNFDSDIYLDTSITIPDTAAWNYSSHYFFQRLAQQMPDYLQNETSFDSLITEAVKVQPTIFSEDSTCNPVAFRLVCYLLRKARLTDPERFRQITAQSMFQWMQKYPLGIFATQEITFATTADLTPFLLHKVFWAHSTSLPLAVQHSLQLEPNGFYTRRTILSASKSLEFQGKWSLEGRTLLFIDPTVDAVQRIPIHVPLLISGIRFLDPENNKLTEFTFASPEPHSVNVVYENYRNSCTYIPTP